MGAPMLPMPVVRGLMYGEGHDKCKEVHVFCMEFFHLDLDLCGGKKVSPSYTATIIAILFPYLIIIIICNILC